jgi:hypothetical protein
MLLCWSIALVSCSRSAFKSIGNFSKDHVGGSRPDKRLWIAVVGLNVIEDGRFQVLDGSKGSPANALPILASSVFSDFHCEPKNDRPLTSLASRPF